MLAQLLASVGLGGNNNGDGNLHHSSSNGQNSNEPDALLSADGIANQPAAPSGAGITHKPNPTFMLLGGEAAPGEVVNGAENYLGSIGNLLAEEESPDSLRGNRRPRVRHFKIILNIAISLCYL